MSLAEPRNRYSTVSLWFHWVTAVLVLSQIVLIVSARLNDEYYAPELIPIHKSLGIAILVLTVARIGWRLLNPMIALPATMPHIQRVAARATHVLFYVILIAMPLLGWAASSATGREIDWFGLFLMPILPVPFDRDLAGVLMRLHEAAGKLLYVLLALHIAGALKQHFVDRDNVLHRMIPIIPRRP